MGDQKRVGVKVATQVQKSESRFLLYQSNPLPTYPCEPKFQNLPTVESFFIYFMAFISMFTFPSLPMGRKFNISGHSPIIPPTASMQSSEIYRSLMFHACRLAPMVIHKTLKSRRPLMRYWVFVSHLRSMVVNVLVYQSRLVSVIVAIKAPGHQRYFNEKSLQTALPLCFLCHVDS